MSKEEINAIETIVDQCEILHSYAQNLLAVKILLCITYVLCVTIEPKENDD